MRSNLRALWGGCTPTTTTHTDHNDNNDNIDNKDNKWDDQLYYHRRELHCICRLPGPVAPVQ